ncbi:MAG TPA: radical SAM protein [Candidatus Methanoperedens sp.]|nr:radical SAM protein [Candidatus Methanoperedens sp.]
MRPYSPLRHAGALLVKRRPLHLTFFVTRRCDARCPFCFSRGRRAPEAPELSAAEIARLAPTVGPLLWLAFSGGEPTLRDDLPEIAAILARRCRPVFVLLSTNGLDPARTVAATRELLAAAPRSTVAVKLSLDGPAELHDRLRGVPGAHARVLESLALLREVAAGEPRLEIGVNTVLCAANQSAVEEVFAEVARLNGVRTHTLSLVRGELPDPALGAVDARRYREAAEALTRGLQQGSQPRYRFAGARLKAAQDVLQRRLIAETLARRERVIPCHAGRLNLVLDERGELFPCEDFSLRLGNVREHGLDVRATAASPRGRAVLALIARGECWCTHECTMMTNILFTPRHWPALAREYFRQPGSLGRP